MLEKNYSKEIEQKWQKFWEEKKIYAFEETDETQNPKPIYSIDTPPPFTSGELHMGHVLSYSYFDFAARYKRMNGYNVYYPQGWDTQGFPTEVRVEKKFGRLPAEQFRQKCIEWTYKMIAKMKQQMIEMGFSPDWKYEYKTMEPEYHYKVQFSLIQMYKNKEIYRASYPVHWCPNCASAIAKAELEDIERETTLNYIKFTDARSEKPLIIATTRPELLSACVAMMFNPTDERYKNLEGMKAKTPLGDEVPIITDKDVEKEFGTGLMMVCTFGDKMDVVWAHRYKLPFKSAIDQHGRMQNSSELNGLKIEEARKKIIEKLNNEGKLLKQEKKLQIVKVHDRCRTPVEFITSMQWFGDIKAKTEKIKKFAAEIKWIPSFGITYLNDWVDNIDWDWVISRQRVFGTPIPFYYCEKCNEIAPADELPFYPEKAKPKNCKCGSQMKPESSVCDCWVDSSITPLIISGWPNNRKMMEKIYPSSLRPQGVEIVRTWAFYTIYRCGMLTGKIPWETILLNGNVLAPDGKKMSKSSGNVISPQQLQAEYPTDAIRQWAALSGAMAKDRPFSYEDIKYAKSFLTKLWNSAKFIEGSLNDYDDNYEKGEIRWIDKWIISRMNETIFEFTKHIENFEYHYAMNKLYQFYWHDFCDHYLEYVKHRIYAPQIYGEESKKAAQYSLKYVLYNTIKLLAPITPHISEEIWKELFEGQEINNCRQKKDSETYQSIHKSNWPKPGVIDQQAIAKAQIANEIVKLIRQYKANNKKAMNSPLSFVKIKSQDIHEFEDDIKGVMKIEKLEIEKSEKIELLSMEFAD